MVGTRTFGFVSVVALVFGLLVIVVIPGNVTLTTVGVVAIIASVVSLLLATGTYLGNGRNAEPE